MKLVVYNECDKHQRVYTQGFINPQLRNTTERIYSRLGPTLISPSLSQTTPPIWLKSLGPVPIPLAPQPVNKCHITHMALVALTVT